MSGQFSWPGPQNPGARITIPEVAFTELVGGLGWRLGWLKAHSCPCSYATGLPGSPNPRCITCGGRGIYWDSPAVDFRGLITFGHTTFADEPGAATREQGGHVMYGEPTLTIPHKGALNEETVWHYASSFDAIVEYDALSRFNSILTKTDLPSSGVLPYQYSVEILSITAYSLASNSIKVVHKDDWNYSNGVVTLSDKFPEGTSFTVEYLAAPIYVAYRTSGGVPHARPLAPDETKIPRRFHLKMLDEWTRARGGGELPQFGNGPKQV